MKRARFTEEQIGYRRLFILLRREGERQRIWWSMQSFALSPACRADAHVDVGIAGPHRHSRALLTSKEASAPARYVLSASASIHQTPLRRMAEAQSNFCRHTVRETALARALNMRRRALSFVGSRSILASIGCSKTQLAAVKPHAVHAHGELAGDSNDSAPVAPLSCDPQVPCLDTAPLLERTSMARLVKNGANLDVTAFGDVAFSIDGTFGLNASCRRAK